MKQSYEAASKKSIKGTPLKTPEKSSQKNEIGGNSSNRTVQHFNKLIIDERRKLDGLEKKILEAKKSLGRLEPHEIFEDSESSKTDDRSADNHRHSNGINESKPSFTPPPRRASVSLRQALATPTGIQQRKPFQAVQEDEDEDDDRRGVFGRVSKTPFSPQPTHSSPYLTRFDSPEEDENTIGLTKHDIDRKLLFKKSEADRLQLIEENRRLRSEITQVTSKIYDRTNEKDISTDNLSYVINELNGWDIERDELDAQIDRLMAQKEELIQKLISTSRGVKYRTKNPQEL